MRNAGTSLVEIAFRNMDHTPAADCGVIETPDGREIRFGSASVVDAEFSKLEIGDRVRFTGVSSDDGPAAGTVHVEGEHYEVG